MYIFKVTCMCCPTLFHTAELLVTVGLVLFFLVQMSKEMVLQTEDG